MRNSETPRPGEEKVFMNGNLLSLYLSFRIWRWVKLSQWLGWVEIVETSSWLGELITRPSDKFVWVFENGFLSLYEMTLLLIQLGRRRDNEPSLALWGTAQTPLSSKWTGSSFSALSAGKD